MAHIKLNLTIIILSLIIITSSCIPARQFEEEKNRREKCETEAKDLKNQNQDLQTQVTELTSRNNEIQKRLLALEKDTSITGVSLRNMSRQYDKINSLNQELISQLEKLKAGNIEETKKISGQLQLTQEELLKKEEALKKLESELALKKSNLDRLSDELSLAQADLKKKEVKLDELQSILNRKDSVVNSLKNKVSSALYGFENKGLTVDIKNGKVYVSLENTLLFASGKWNVDPKGVEALKNLAGVLETNTDINVLVEGHTDNVPYRGGGDIKDNWDLSVKRATSIVKILVENSEIDPKRLTAAGKSEYIPIEPGNTPEARAKNRRTEIILTPKLDELFQILETN